MILQQYTVGYYHEGGFDKIVFVPSKESKMSNKQPEAAMLIFLQLMYV